jgi:hypothetical protein
MMQILETIVGSQVEAGDLIDYVEQGDRLADFVHVETVDDLGDIIVVYGLSLNEGDKVRAELNPDETVHTWGA